MCYFMKLDITVRHEEVDFENCKLLKCDDCVYTLKNLGLLSEILFVFEINFKRLSVGYAV